MLILVLDLEIHYYLILVGLKRIQVREMALFKYFAIKDKLPNPNGSLSAPIPSLSIAAAIAQSGKLSMIFRE